MSRWFHPDKLYWTKKISQKVKAIKICTQTHSKYWRSTRTSMSLYSQIIVKHSIILIKQICSIHSFLDSTWSKLFHTKKYHSITSHSSKWIKNSFMCSSIWTLLRKEKFQSITKRTLSRWVLMVPKIYSWTTLVTW